MVVPKQASWITRKILEARQFWMQSQYTTTNNAGLIIQIYLKMLGDGDRVPWKRMMFGNVARNKAIFIMWLQLQKRLLTKDRLLNWGIDVNADCVMCQKALESMDHLFVHCEFTQHLWTKILNWMQRHSFNSNNWEDHLMWMIQRAKGKAQRAQIFKMVYAETVYAIWHERNQRIFEQKAKEADVFARNVAYVCNIRAPGGSKYLVQSWMI
ncbi:uncharacterized protein LOC132637771 [Lycium barbarum]|uniref:uncharacterized protein LOC132637771 n=1 Tax=Lycium barbarum TaxID=112863 RepID=UPI00293E8795|nr:uncharacterized protein LOC132637771 [Lycium barbarum]